MEAKIQKERNNPLLGRKEYVLTLSYEGPTPSRKEVREACVQKLGFNPDLTVVRRTDRRFGKKSINVKVHVYENKERMEQIEPKYVLNRNGLVGDSDGGKEGEKN